MTQAFYTGLPWPIHRNKSGWPRWWQRFYEAWLVVTGKYTFWHAFDQGKHCGSVREYQRILGNGGDLTPLLDAAVDEFCPDAKTFNERGEKRRAIWVRYEKASATNPLLTAYRAGPVTNGHHGDEA